MYKFSYFTEEDQDKVLEFIKATPFAIITGKDNDKDYPVATHIPLHPTFENDKMILTGHMMKNTDHHKTFVNNPQVLVLFNGPHCFVSSSWYTGAMSASTWNYMTVHAKGKISFADEARTREIVEEITNRYEGMDSIRAFKHLPVEYVDKLVKAIAGFTIAVESMDNVFKLSQNHETETRESIIKHLEETGDDGSMQIAIEMKKRISHYL